MHYIFNDRHDTSTLDPFDSDPGDFAELESFTAARFAVSYRFGADPMTEPLSESFGDRPSLPEGYYAGFDGIYGLGGMDGIYDGSERSRPRDVDLSVVGDQFELEGAGFGAHVGYRVMRDRLSFGLEGALEYLGQSDRQQDPDDVPPPGLTDAATTDLNWIASVKGRVGYGSAHSQIFATGGLAWIDADYSAFDAAPNFVTAKTDISSFGYVLGLGVEHQLTDAITVKAELSHYGFDKKHDTSTLTPDSDPGDFVSIDDITIAKVGLSFSLPIGD